MPALRSRIWLCIFASGFSALLHQVVWHRYLAILLGAQARATAVTIAIFLSGLCGGYFLFGRWSRNHPHQLWKGYALIELGLGLWAAVFGTLFQLARPLAAFLHSTFGATSLAVDLLISLFLLLPPTLLLGGTLPLLTQLLSENVGTASRTHATIYALNTLGACSGSLVAGYALIPWLGLPATLCIGSLLNLAIGFYVYRHTVKGTPTLGSLSPAPTFQPDRAPWPLLAVAFLSGFYVITLETVFIRFVGLSVGPSPYSFTLMVSIFILGLGLGGWWVRSRALKTEHLYWNQLELAIALIFIYLSVPYWPYAVHLLRIQFRDLSSAFYLYQWALLCGFGLLLVLPVALCGMTLPLCFHLMKNTQDTLGFRVGQLYGINTVGCVLGALVGGHWALYVLNLDHLFRLCIALVTCSAGIALYYGQTLGVIERRRVTALAALLLVLSPVLSRLPPHPKDPYIQPFLSQRPTGASFHGPEIFHTHLRGGSQWVFFKDGPSASIGVLRAVESGNEVSRVVLVNGKADSDTRADRLTTALLGHLPALFSRVVEKACVVGFGTGVTAGALATHAGVKSIDLVEISGTLLKHKALFDAYNGAVSQNPKIRFHEIDALRYLAGTRQTFDIIVSKPSNPWVTAAENLYTAEFYRGIRHRLHPSGMFVQWIHTYSFTDKLLHLVLRTLKAEFPVIHMFHLQSGDVALVASAYPIEKADLERAQARFSEPSVKESLASVGVTRLETLLALETMPPELVNRATAEPGPKQRLENPMLSYQAVRAFFAQASVDIHGLKRRHPEYYTFLETYLLPTYLTLRPAGVEVAAELRRFFCDGPYSREPHFCEESLALSLAHDPSFELSPNYQNLLQIRPVQNAALFRQAGQGPFTEKDFDRLRRMTSLYLALQSPIAQLPEAQLLTEFDRCTQHATSEAMRGECALEKLLYLSNTGRSGSGFQRLAVDYFSWFNKNAAQLPNFTRLAQGKTLLENLLSGGR